MGFYVILIVLILLLLIPVLASVFFFKIACVRDKPKPTEFVLKNPENPWAKNYNKITSIKEKFKKIEHEKIELKSFDGTLLAGNFYKLKEASGGKVALIMHGFRCHGRDDVIVAANMLIDKGYSVLLVSQRSHGESGGKYISFGIKERYDCKIWCEEIVKLCGENVKICLFGVSMGAATVMMASNLALPSQVKAIVADCGFTSPYAIYKHVLKLNYHLPPFPILSIADIFAKLFAKFSFKDASAKEALKKTKIPVLFIHGDKDDYVPTWMSLENYKACASKKEILIVENAVHAVSFLIDPELCRETMYKFLDENLES